jgi:hypothetical protein
MVTADVRGVRGRGGLSLLVPAVPVPRSGALLGFLDPDPVVVFAGYLPVDAFFFPFLRSIVCHSVTAACPPVITGVFEAPVSTLLAVFSETTSFPFFLSVLSGRFSINRASTVPSCFIVCSNAVKGSWTLVSHAGRRGSLRLQCRQECFRYGGGTGSGVRPSRHLPYAGGEYVRCVP